MRVRTHTHTCARTYKDTRAHTSTHVCVRTYARTHPHIDAHKSQKRNPPASTPARSTLNHLPQPEQRSTTYPTQSNAQPPPPARATLNHLPKPEQPSTTYPSSSNAQPPIPARATLNHLPQPEQRSTTSPSRSLTLFEDDPAEESVRVCGGAVPPPVLELRLALLYGHQGASLHAVHQFHVPTTQSSLSFHQPSQGVATVFLRQASHPRHLGQSSVRKEDSKRDY